MAPKPDTSPLFGIMSIQHARQFTGWDGEANAGAANLGHRHTDQAFLAINDRPTAVPGIEVAIELHDGHLIAVIFADAGNGRLANGDGRVAATGRKALAKGEAEDEHGHGFDQFGLLAQVDRSRQAGDTGHLEDGKIAVGVGGHQFRRDGLFLPGATEENRRQSGRRPGTARNAQRHGNMVIGNDVTDAGVGADQETRTTGRKSAGVHLDEDRGSLEFVQGFQGQGLVGPQRGHDTAQTRQCKQAAMHRVDSA
jgi:hypothetical protein